MKRKRRSLSEPPVEWIDLLEGHAQRVHRVRLLWRRGSSTYRPMVPIDVDLDELEGRPASEWERLELPETHFEWALADDALDDPHAEVCELVSELWRLAADYTRDFGSWCDYKLAGFDEQGEQLFAHGCRCRLPHRRTGRNRDLEPEPEQPPEPPATTPQPPAQQPVLREDFGAFKDASMWVDGRKDQLIGALASEREWSANSARDALDSAPKMFSQAGDILQSAITYQNKVVEQIRDQASGEADLRQRVVAESERTKRFSQGIGLAKDLADLAISSLLPFANHVVEVLGDRNIMVYPQFKTAQQAMCYLCCSLTATRLARMFDNNRDAAGAFLGMLDDGSRVRSEREALELIVDAVLMLRSERFEQNSTTEERLAARFIIGQFAMYRMDLFGSED